MYQQWLEDLNGIMDEYKRNIEKMTVDDFTWLKTQPQRIVTYRNPQDKNSKTTFDNVIFDLTTEAIKDDYNFDINYDVKNEKVLLTGSNISLQRHIDNKPLKEEIFKEYRKIKFKELII